MLDDIRYGLRMMRKTPGFTVIAVLTLALGIGANTAVFSAVKGVVFMFPPVPQPSRIVRLWARNVTTDMPRMLMSMPDFEDVRQQNHSFSGTAAWTTTSWLLDTGKGPLRVSGARVSADFFRVLGVEPALGRNFSGDEDRAGAPLVAIISQKLWAQTFASDTGVFGRSLALDGASYTIIGVMPESFWYQARGVDIWTPLLPPASGWNRAERAYQVFGRLRTGVKDKALEAEMTLIAQRLEREHPDSNANWTFVPISLWDEQMKRIGTSAVMLFGPVLFVLLIACANVGNMLLARATVRRGEMAVRAALGAARGRLIRQLLTESALLSLAGALLGVALAAGGIRIFLALLPPSAADVKDYIRIDLSMFLFALAVALLTALMFGLSPALTAARLDLNSALKERENASGLGRKKQRGRDRLIAWEVGLAVIFLVVTGALVRGIGHMESTASQPGFDAHNLIAFDVTPLDSRFRTADQLAQYHRDLRERLAAVPGVASVGAVAALPLVGGRTSPRAATLDPAPANDAKPFAVSMPVLPGYFESMRIPVLRGRAIGAQDARGAMPVACVSNSFAHRYWPNQDALGKHVKLGAAADSPWLTVVGVVGDVLENPATGNYPPYVYSPHAQNPARGMTFTVRPAGAAAAVIPVLKRAVWSFDKEQPLEQTETVQQMIDAEFRGSWAVLALMGTFAAVGLVLAAAGVYGVMSFLAAQRTREVGVRMALGASPRQILWQHLGHGASLIGIGLGVALLLIFVIMRLVADPRLVNVYDPLPYAIAGGALAAAALLGTYIPARRAARVDPMVALRCD